MGPQGLQSSSKIMFSTRSSLVFLLVIASCLARKPEPEKLERSARILGNLLGGGGSSSSGSSSSSGVLGTLGNLVSGGGSSSSSSSGGPLSTLGNLVSGDSSPDDILKDSLIKFITSNAGTLLKVLNLMPADLRNQVIALLIKNLGSALIPILMG